MTPQIASFVREMQTSFPKIKRTNFQNFLQFYSGMSAFDLERTKLDCWLNREGAGLFHVHGNAFSFIEGKDVPILYKILLKYTFPSVRRGAGRISIENLQLIFDETTEQNVFMMPNPDMVLKHSDASSCLATPIVVAGLEQTKSDEDKESVCFQKMRNDGVLAAW